MVGSRGRGGGGGCKINLGMRRGLGIGQKKNRRCAKIPKVIPNIRRGIKLCTCVIQEYSTNDSNHPAHGRGHSVPGTIYS